ncbi:MAG: Holliday junction branch migration protein RuvA [Patescibacteria group bacterium]
MIAFLEGILAEHEVDAIIVNVSGVGYRIFTTRVSAEVGEKVKLFISEVIREDRHDLYGFLSRDEKELFVLLTDVQGVGPKIGQKILAAASAEALRKHIQTGDLAFFTSISGVGKKTAQKIILDLKGVLVGSDTDTLVRDDVTDALENLGYSREDIVAVLPHVSGETSADRVKSALKMIGKQR